MSLSSPPVDIKPAVSNGDLSQATVAVPARSLAFLRSVLAVVGGTILLALCAHVALPLPFTPVPGTMQTFAVLVLGMTMGPVLGPLTMAAYFLEGAAGLPVFAPTTAIPSATLFGPTIGYIVSYGAATWVASASYQQLRSAFGSFLAALAAGALALFPTFLIGAAWLAIALHLSLQQAVEFGVLPFLPGEAVKLSLAALVIASLHRLRLTR